MGNDKDRIITNLQKFKGCLRGRCVTSLDANKAIIRKLIAAINTRNLDALDELVAYDFAFRTNHIRGLDVIKRAIEE